MSHETSRLISIRTAPHLRVPTGESRTVNYNSNGVRTGNKLERPLKMSKEHCGLRENIFCIDDALSGNPPIGFCGARSNREGQRPAKVGIDSQVTKSYSAKHWTPLSIFERSPCAATSRVNDERNALCGAQQLQPNLLHVQAIYKLRLHLQTSSQLAPPWAAAVR